MMMTSHDVVYHCMRPFGALNRRAHHGVSHCAALLSILRLAPPFPPLILLVWANRDSYDFVLPVCVFLTLGNLNNAGHALAYGITKTAPLVLLY